MNIFNNFTQTGNNNTQITQIGGKININGKSYLGSSINVNGDDIYIDGKKVDDSQTNQFKEIKIIIEGNCGNINTNGSVQVLGNVEGDVDTNGKVEVKGDVKGNIDTNGKVEVGGNVSGKIKAVGKVVVEGKNI